MKVLPAVLLGSLLLAAGWFARGWKDSPAAVPVLAPTSSSGQTVKATGADAKQKQISSDAELQQLLSQLSTMDRFDQIEAMNQFAKSLPLAKLQEWGAALTAAPGLQTVLEEFRAIVFRRWAKLDLDSAWKHCVAFVSDEFSSTASAEVVSAMVHRGADAAWQKFLSLPESKRTHFGNQFVAFISEADPEKSIALSAGVEGGSGWLDESSIRNWVQKDPDQALAKIASLPAGSERDTCITSAALELANIDPAKALGWAQAFTSKNDRATALYTIIGELAKKDPMQALQSMNGLGLIGEERRTQIEEIYRTWGEKDFPGALAHTLNLPTGGDRITALEQISRGVGKDGLVPLLQAVAGMSIKDARTVIENLDWSGGGADVKSLIANIETTFTNPQLQAEALTNAISSLRYENPKAAVELYAKLDPAHRTDLESLAAQYANKSPEEAYQWIQGLDGKSKLEAIEGFANGICQDTCTKAVAYLDKISNPEEASAFKKVIARNWAEENPAQALAWSKTQGGEVEGIVLHALITQNLHADPEAAKQYFAQLAPIHAQLGPESDTSGLAGSLAEELVTQNPQKAAEFLTTLPAGDARESALSKMTAAWVRADPEPASKWVQSLPAGPERDQAAKSLALEIVAEDPSSALTWLFSIGDSTKQQQSLSEAITAWKYSSNPQVKPNPSSLDASHFSPKQWMKIQQLMGEN